MRQVARGAGMQRGQQQEGAGLFVGDQLARQFAREMESGFKVHRMHLRPDLRGDAKRVIGFTPRRRGAVHEMRHTPDGGGSFRQQRIARRGTSEIADPGYRQFRPGRGLDGRRHRVGVHVGKHRTHALADQRLRDRAADPVTCAGDQRRLARRVEWIVEQGHRFMSPIEADFIKPDHTQLYRPQDGIRTSSLAAPCAVSVRHHLHR